MITVWQWSQNESSLSLERILGGDKRWMQSSCTPS